MAAHAYLASRLGSDRLPHDAQTLSDLLSDDVDWTNPGSMMEFERACTLVRTAHVRYHAAVASPAPNRVAVMLGLRDVMMAANLLAIVNAEAQRGPCLAFAHNAHLQRHQSSWELAGMDLRWWSAGAIAACVLRKPLHLHRLGLHRHHKLGRISHGPAQPAGRACRRHHRTRPTSWLLSWLRTPGLPEPPRRNPDTSRSNPPSPTTLMRSHSSRARGSRTRIHEMRTPVSGPWLGTLGRARTCPRVGGSARRRSCWGVPTMRPSVEPAFPRVPLCPRRSASARPTVLSCPNVLFLPCGPSR